MADEGTPAGAYQPADQDRRRKDHADRCTNGEAGPAATLGRLLYLVYNVDLALFVLGDDGGVVGSDDVLAVELLQSLEIRLGVIDALVLTHIQKHRVVAHCA